MKKFLVIFGILFLSAVWAWTHSGRTDKKGGHYNRKTGEYHYHNSGVASANVDEVEILKAQVSTLSAEVEQLKVYIKDLYFMTEPLRILVADKDGGNYYHARSYFHRRIKVWGMLPSELERANLYYNLRWGKHGKAEGKALSDKLLKMGNPYLNSYESEYSFSESLLTRDPDHPNPNAYFLPVSVGKVIE